MRYTVKNELQNDVKIFSENKLAPRAYFIPFADIEKMDATTLLDERFNSDRVQLLSGEWDFKYFSNCKDIPSTFDSAELEFSTVKVPSTWQRTGYENPCYLNSRYEFKLKPPIVPANMPAAIYRRNFVTTSNNGKKYTITFLGVCSAVALYMNGDYVGYSEGSHNTAEFDVTKYMRNGINELLCVVYKWCNGSYLECQDMFRENGIFRDVYITENEECNIVDFDVKTHRRDNGNYDLKVSIALDGVESGEKIEVEVYDDSKAILHKSSLVAANVSFSFEDLQVKEWSAEQPKLYTIYLTLRAPSMDCTIVRHRIGFKTVEIKGEVFCLNGQNIKIKGVNHHDTDTKNGWVMTPEQLERDVKIIKQYNCNAVRMSHYPPDPILIALCDEYGLYVIDEADIECHGIYSNPLNQRFGRISNKLMWKNHFVDRVSNMYMRDRNFASIIMWSLGNEAGGYLCHDAAYDYLKSVSTIPVHYEGVIHTKRHSYDVVSEMYPHSDKVKKIGEHTLDAKWAGKPYFLCEYAHSMGVGPGALEVYMQTFMKYDNIMGGCIWEFCDHAVEHAEGAKWKYTYGGDHGEIKHDKNFCVDGLFFPDRTPSTGALNMKNVYRPIRAELKGNKIIFNNTNRFKNTNDIVAKVAFYQNGNLTGEKSVVMNIEPKHYLEYEINVDVDKAYDNYVVITYFAGAEEVAFEQLIVSEANYIMDIASDARMVVDSTNNIHTIRFVGGSCIYDGNNGELVSYNIDNVEMINPCPRLGRKGMLPNMYRGLLDNDMFIQILWKIIGMQKNLPKYKGSSIIVSENSVNICAKYCFSSFGNIAKVSICYLIKASGEIDVTVKATKGLKMFAYNDIVRLGITLEMPKEFENIEYYGRGDKESFSDFYSHTKLGIYHTKVSQMHDRYVKPQESGNRSDVRYAKVTNAAGKGLLFAQGDKYFNFNANHYTYKELKAATHTEDLVDYPTTNVQIDGFMRGVGSQSCGQGPLAAHKPNMSKPLEYNFKIIPIK